MLVLCSTDAKAFAGAPSYIDRRVTAIPAATLLHAPPQQLVDRRRQRVAVRLHEFTRPLSLLWALSQIAALFYLWKSGWAARLRDALKRSIPFVALVRFIYGGLLAMYASLASFLVALIQYRVQRTFGLTGELGPGWLHDWIVSVGLEALWVGLIVTYVLWLLGLTRLWYLYAMAGLCVATLATAYLEPLVVAPLYERFTPLPAGSALAVGLRALERKAGAMEAPIYIASDASRSPLAAASISGIGPTKRIVLDTTLLHSATRAEVLFLTARELGHYVDGDNFRLSLFWTLLFISCVALGVLAADRVGFRRDDDPLARLALALALTGIAALLEAPLYNFYSRALEARADRYAVALTGNRAAAVRSFVRTADEGLEPLCSSSPLRFYLSNTPPLGARIAAVTGQPDPCR